MLEQLLTTIYGLPLCGLYAQMYEIPHASRNLPQKYRFMHAFTFVFGAMPMLFVSGAGAASLVSMGCAVVFSMAINAFIGTLFIPDFEDFMERIGGRFGSMRGKSVK